MKIFVFDDCSGFVYKYYMIGLLGDGWIEISEDIFDSLAYDLRWRNFYTLKRENVNTMLFLDSDGFPVFKRVKVPV